MKNKLNVRWMAQTALMIALLLCLQYLTQSLGQLVTGSCVNAVLAITVLVVGMGGGITVALLSPVFAYLLGIAPQLVTVPAIMAGNAVFVVLLKLLYSPKLWKQVLALAVAAAAKFAVLYVLVVQIVCNLASGYLLEQQLLKAPMLTKLPAMFTWPQLFTALIGGGLALLITPLIKKALKK